MTTDLQYEEMKSIVKENLCASCGGELSIHTTEIDTLEVWCPHNPDHHGYIERKTYTQLYRRGVDIHPAIKGAIEKKMLPGGYELGVALALIKVRFPRADLDDPSAALFVMDCMRLDLDPLLGEIVPITFRVTDKETKEVHRVVQPVLTEDGWLSLCARACPERWAGPPITEPITDKEFNKNLCGDEEAWVWKATGKTKDGNESVGYGWLKQSEYQKAKAAGTPAGELPGNQARVRAIKRWVRETFPEAKAKMKEMTSEWLARGRDVEGVQQIIAAEYHIVTDTEPSKGDESGEPEAKKPGAASPGQKTETAPATEAKTPDEVIEGEDFHIDLTWLKESLKTLKWSEDTCKTFLISKYKVSPRGSLTDIINRLTREQAEDFTKEINGRVEKQASLF